MAKKRRQTPKKKDEVLTTFFDTLDDLKAYINKYPRFRTCVTYYCPKNGWALEAPESLLQQQKAA